MWARISNAKCISIDFGAGPLSGSTVTAVQDPESKTAEQYSARNRFVKELTGLGFTFDHYGKCKYGTEANAAELPPPHKVRWWRFIVSHLRCACGDDLQGGSSEDRCLALDQAKCLMA